MQRMLTAGLMALLTLALAPARAVTLDQAMADPDWIGPPVQQAWWSVDGKALHYRLKRSGSPVRDLHRIDLASGQDTVLDGAAIADSDGPDAVFDARRQRAAFARNGDIFIRELTTGALLQVTRTPEIESSPVFSPGGDQLHYRQGNDWFTYDIARRVAGPAAVVKASKDPQAKEPNDLERQQLRYFSTLRTLKAEREALREDNESQVRADPTRVPLPFHIGDDVEIVGTSLAPDARHMLVVTAPKSHDRGQRGKLQRYVTESGYEEQEEERTFVGRNLPAPQSLILLDLVAHTIHPLAWDSLPGIHDDPLAAVREENARLIAEEGGAETGKVAGKDKAKAAKGKRGKDQDTPKARAVRVASLRMGSGGIQWSADGRQAAVQIRAIDNKDRWIATVDLAGRRLVSRHRLTDPAWINWNFNDFGFTQDGSALWFLSEESGWSQLYIARGNATPKALTTGRFEVSEPVESPDGQWFYVRANAEQPYIYDVYRVPVAGGKLERVTRQQAIQAFALSPDGSRLAVLHSSSHVPTQLGLVPAAGGEVQALTDTRTAEYKALEWPALEVVEVPSRHADQPVRAKLYKPADFDPARRYPAVLFVHGAGYLQNVHLGWPNYFREQMFHHLLTERGYVVLDMDFRASEGYGRDWRTAIYRNMGKPELEDLIDGVEWLVEHHAVDRERVGLYGGSYGGFMALMAMFKAPEVFKAGAALRPVTDWAQYNHEYTSNILNTPQDDPIAYRRSSPIEFAEGLEGGLLIAHGMIDDNVLFADSVRLFQRLVELRKDDFELAGYPLERHGFVHADAWYDEYRRILKLFEEHLKD